MMEIMSLRWVDEMSWPKCFQEPKKQKKRVKLFKWDVKLFWLSSRKPVTTKFASILANQNKPFCQQFPSSNLLSHRTNCIFGLKSKFDLDFSKESGIFLFFPT